MITSTVTSDGQPADADAGEHVDVGLGGNGPAKNPLERRAPHDQDGQVLVARLRVTEVEARGQLRAPRLAQCVEDIGEPVAQHGHHPGQEPVGLVGLGRTPPLGGEGLVGVGHGRNRIALDQRDRVPGAAERECHRQAPDSPADDHHPLGS